MHDCAARCCHSHIDADAAHGVCALESSSHRVGNSLNIVFSDSELDNACHTNDINR